MNEVKIYVMGRIWRKIDPWDDGLIKSFKTKTKTKLCRGVLRISMDGWMRIGQSFFGEITHMIFILRKT